MRNLLLILPTIIFLTFGMNAQEKAMKSQLQKGSVFVEMMDSGTFEFFANTAIPMGMSSRNLVGDDYSVKFSEEKITSDLPYFGTAYSGMGSRKDQGLRFEGKPETYKVVKVSDKEYIVKAVVKTDEDNFEITMSVSDSGYADLIIKSRKRDVISFRGEVAKPRK